MAAHRKFTFENPEDSYWNLNDFVDDPFDDSSITNAVINQIINHSHVLYDVL